MLFSSYAFILVFLPLCWLAFRASLALAGLNSLVRLLALCSLAFYGYWNPWHVPLILGSMAVNYRLSLWIRSHASRARTALWLGIFLNLGLIGIYKYLGFFTANVNHALGSDLPLVSLALPLGISFFTFQQIAYLIDTTRGEQGARNFPEYALFVLFFPQLIAGPIVHPREVLPQFRDKEQFWRHREFAPQGIALFSIGLFKKVVIADTLAPHADRVFGLAASDPGALSWFDAWAGVLSYSLQIYFDFSGYSDMAIGLGLLFGIVIPMNFNSPYGATSIIEFWRRWHITLSTFLRDYLYVALGGNRRGHFRRYLNLLATMVIGGFWHGANWTFIAWGAAHGLMLALNHLLRSVFASVGIGGSRLLSLGGWMLTMLGVTLAWVLFRAASMADAARLYGIMLTDQAMSLPRSLQGLTWVNAPGQAWRLDGLSPAQIFTNPLQHAALLAILIAAVALLPNAAHALVRPEPGNQAGVTLAPVRWLSTWWGAGCIALVFTTAFLALGRVQAFLYFQF